MAIIAPKPEGTSQRAEVNKCIATVYKTNTSFLQRSHYVVGHCLATKLPAIGIRVDGHD